MLLLLLWLFLYSRKYSGSEGNVKIKMSNQFYDIYNSVKEKHDSLSKYISMIRLYSDLYLKKAKQLTEKQIKLQVNSSKDSVFRHLATKGIQNLAIKW